MSETMMLEMSALAVAAFSFVAMVRRSLKPVKIAAKAAEQTK